jgi:hypothetical protein
MVAEAVVAAAAQAAAEEAAELGEVRERRVLAPVQVDMVAGQVEDMAAA